MRDLNFVEQVAAVGRAVRFHVHDVNHVFILRVSNDVHVVPGALPQAVVGIHQNPVLPSVIGAVETSVGVVRLHQGVNTL